MANEIEHNRVENFFRKEYKKLVNYVYKNMEKRYADSSPEDIVQDVALRLLDKFDIDSQIENLAAYIYKSLRNRIIDNNKRKRFSSMAGNISEPLKSEIQNCIDSNQEELSIYDIYEPAELYAAIDKLSDEDKFIIRETHFKGKSFQDFSVELKKPLGTLLSRKHRAQEKLAKILVVNQQY